MRKFNFAGTTLSMSLRFLFLLCAILTVNVHQAQCASVEASTGDLKSAAKGAGVKPELFIPCLLSQPFLLAMNEFEKSNPDDVVFLRIRKMGELTEMLANENAGTTVFLGDLELANLIRAGKLKYRSLSYLYYMDTPLALIVRQGLEGKIDKAADLVIDDIDKIMFPSPEIHSLGDRVKEILEKENIYEKIRERVSFIPPDKMILQYITDEGDGKGAKASIVYSDCILSNSSSGTMPRGITVVKKWSPGFFTPIPVYTVHEERAPVPVARFLKFLRTPKVISIFAQAGYGVNGQGGEQGKLLSLLPPAGEDDCPDCPIRTSSIEKYPEGSAIASGKGGSEIPAKYASLFDEKGKPVFPIVIDGGVVNGTVKELEKASEQGSADISTEFLAEMAPAPGSGSVRIIGLMPPTDCKNDLLMGLLDLATSSRTIHLELLDMFSKEARKISMAMNLKCSAILVDGSYTWKIATDDDIRDVVLKGAPGSFTIDDVLLAVHSAMAARGIPVPLGPARPHADFSVVSDPYADSADSVNTGSAVHTPSASSAPSTAPSTTAPTAPPTAVPDQGHMEDSPRQGGKPSKSVSSPDISPNISPAVFQAFSKAIVQLETAALVPLMTREVARVMPEEKLQPFFRGLAEKFGAPVSIGEFKFKSDSRWVSELKFSDITLDLSVVCDSLSRIAGFSITAHTPDIPAPEANTVLMRLPFDGDWYVVWGGETAENNRHHNVPCQKFGFDFVVRDEKGGSYSGKGTVPQDYYAYGRRVLSPAEGVVTDVIDGVRDSVPGTMNPYSALGNAVVIRHADDQYSVLAHFIPGSIGVIPGERVAQGDFLGLCGNSGNSTEPHIHYHLQNTPLLQEATGIRARFTDVLIVSDGMAVAKEFPYSPVKGEVVRQWE
jgi:hypothetical protein